mmetsp:Transcript_13796/g.26473  ORF Transcript_13796/g.26473 Transcript_13796/m.26473 type:complete len:236 (+) Transcript_13796:368-1075(+)
MAPGVHGAAAAGGASDAGGTAQLARSRSPRSPETHSTRIHCSNHSHRRCQRHRPRILPRRRPGHRGPRRLKCHTRRQWKRNTNDPSAALLRSLHQRGSRLLRLRDGCQERLPLGRRARVEDPARALPLVRRHRPRRRRTRPLHLLLDPGHLCADRRRQPLGVCSSRARKREHVSKRGGCLLRCGRRRPVLGAGDGAGVQRRPPRARAASPLHHGAPARGGEAGARSAGPGSGRFP